MSKFLPKVDYQQPTKKYCGIMLVGEAPGVEEVKMGRPFIGRSGQLLDKNLQLAGIEREAVLVANVFRFQPPKNKVAHFFISRKKALEQKIQIAENWPKFSAGYLRKDFEPELLNLKNTIESVRPKIIITLGATALWALTGQTGILNLRGRGQPCAFLPAIQVLPTFHPSYILRGNWKVEPDFLADLMGARSISIS